MRGNLCGSQRFVLFTIHYILFTELKRDYAAGEDVNG
jgi:hypothetical protein